MNIKALILILLFPVALQAQVSIVDALPDIPEGEPDGWGGGASGAISFRDDNNKDRHFEASIGGFMSYEGECWSSIITNKASYEWLNDSEQEASVMTHVRLRLSLGKVPSSDKKDKYVVFNHDEHRGQEFFIETFAQHEYDRFRALNTRGLLGAGLAAVILESNILDIMIGTAYMLEYIDFTNTNDELNHRLSNYLQIEFEPIEEITIESTTFAQFRFDNFNDHVISSSLSLGVKATDWFGIKLGFGLAYDSRPPPNIKDIGVNVGSEIFTKF